jgi:ABC-type Mn2+/Zn2+ transport system ATPase subunit
VSNEEDIEKLNALLDEPFIGVDSEWRPALVKFHQTAPAVL